MAVQTALSPKIVIKRFMPGASRATLEQFFLDLEAEAIRVFTEELTAAGDTRIAFEDTGEIDVTSLGGNIWQFYPKFVIKADPGFRPALWDATADKVRDAMVALARARDGGRVVHEVYVSKRGDSTKETDVTA